MSVCICVCVCVYIVVPNNSANMARGLTMPSIQPILVDNGDELNEVIDLDWNSLEIHAALD